MPLWDPDEPHGTNNLVREFIGVLIIMVVLLMIAFRSK